MTQLSEPEPKVTSRADWGIELEHVTRRFGRKLAVDDLTLRIPRGSTFGFIGANGAGKTTAIRMMVGLLKPHGGSIRVAGFDVPEDRLPMHRHVGYVPDRPNAYAWMRVREAIAFCKPFYKTWNDALASELLRSFDLDPSKRVKHLSKGMGAKLSLLLAIAHEPDVLILDEPMSGLDPLVRDEFLEGLVTTLARREQTVLFSSHNLADVQRLADSVGLLHEGRLIFHSTIDALLERTKRLRAILPEQSTSPRQTPPGVVWQQVNGREWLMTVDPFSRDQIEFLRQKNGIDTVDVLDMSLDDVFKDHLRVRRQRVSA